MDFKKTVKEGCSAIADRYLAERRRASEDVHLLDELIERLPVNAEVLDAGCGTGIPLSQMLSKRRKPGMAIQFPIKPTDSIHR
jgi:hypothetical protein